VRAVFDADPAVLADDRRGVLAREMDGLDDARVGALPALDALLLVEPNAPALPFGECAGGTDCRAVAFVGAGQAVNREKHTRCKTAQGAYFYGAFAIRIAFVVYAGADALAGETADALVHVIRFQDFAHADNPSLYKSAYTYIIALSLPTFKYQPADYQAPGSSRRNDAATMP